MIGIYLRPDLRFGFKLDCRGKMVVRFVEFLRSGEFAGKLRVRSKS